MPCCNSLPAQAAPPRAAAVAGELRTERGLVPRLALILRRNRVCQRMNCFTRSAMARSGDLHGWSVVGRRGMRARNRLTNTQFIAVKFLRVLGCDPCDSLDMATWQIAPLFAPAQPSAAQPSPALAQPIPPQPTPSRHPYRSSWLRAIAIAPRAKERHDRGTPRWTQLALALNAQDLESAIFWLRRSTLGEVPLLERSAQGGRPSAIAWVLR